MRLADAETYEKYAGELVRFATGLVGPDDAADVVSGVFVKVLGTRSWPDVDEQRAYLYQAVLNEVRMRHRSTMGRRAREMRAAGTRQESVALIGFFNTGEAPCDPVDPVSLELVGEDTAGVEVERRSPLRPFEGPILPRDGAVLEVWISHACDRFQVGEEVMTEEVRVVLPNGHSVAVPLEANEVCGVSWAGFSEWE
ncbi:MAG TPA: hypothetical protein VE569_02205 [Acidimicrobiia bacterium]|nr:hypothetical protein [Acidimicrobiia bacterium]